MPGGHDPGIAPTHQLKVFSKLLSAENTAQRGCPEQTRERTAGSSGRGPGELFLARWISNTPLELPLGFPGRASGGPYGYGFPRLPVLHPKPLYAS